MKTSNTLVTNSSTIDINSYMFAIEADIENDTPMKSNIKHTKKSISRMKRAARDTKRRTY